MKITNPMKKEEYLSKYSVQSLFQMDITELLEIHQYKRDDFICRELEELNRLYFIVEGRVKMYQTLRNGKISLISFYSEGSILGEVELLGVMKTAHSVQAVMETVCLELPLYHIKEEVLKDVTFLQQIARYLGHKAIQNADHVMKSQAYPLECRLANFIIMSSSEAKYEEKHTEVAQYLGVSYRHLLRTFAEFTKRGLISKEGQAFRIIDREELIKLGEELIELD